MQTSTQLLCTFTTVGQLENTLKNISSAYTITFNTIYVLENTDVVDALCCTYNVPLDSPVNAPIPEATISLHRKKATNTLYTINALNSLVAELNGGKIDRRYQLEWENYRNTILVTAYGKFKQINTKLHRIVKIDESA